MPHPADACYLARCRECGQLRCATLDAPYRADRVARLVSRWISMGLVVSRGTAQDVVADPVCHCPTPPKPVHPDGHTWEEQVSAATQVRILAVWVVRFIRKPEIWIEQLRQSAAALGGDMDFECVARTIEETIAMREKIEPLMTAPPISAPREPEKDKQVA